MDRPRPLGRLERAVKHRQMLVLDIRRAFDGAGSVNVDDNLVGFVVIVPQLEQRRRHRVVHDLDHPAAHQLLVLHQRQIRLDAGSVAIHHEADCSCWSENCDLGVAVAVFFAVGEGFVPAVLCWIRRESVGTFVLLMLLTIARCMRITSRNGSRLMYQPGQAPPGMDCELARPAERRSATCA